MRLPKRVPPHRVPTLFASACVYLAGSVVVGCQVLSGVDDALPERNGSSEGGADAAVVGEGGGGPTNAYARAVLDDAPVLYLRFSETSGARAVDTSGGRRDQVVTGAYERARPGLIANDPDPSLGLRDGAQLVLASLFDYPLSVPFTYELWVRVDRRGEVFSNLTGAPPNLRGTAIYLSDALPMVGFERWSNELLRSAHLRGDLVPAPGGIVHLAVVNTPEKPILYVNGARNEGYAGASGTLPAPSALIVGNAPGDYDEIAIYDKALDASRIALHFAIGRGE